MRGDHAFFLVSYSFTMFLLGVFVGYLVSDLLHILRQHNRDKNHDS